MEQTQPAAGTGSSVPLQPCGDGDAVPPPSGPSVRPRPPDGHQSPERRGSLSPLTLQAGNYVRRRLPCESVHCSGADSYTAFVAPSRSHSWEGVPRGCERDAVRRSEARAAGTAWRCISSRRLPAQPTHGSRRAIAITASIAGTIKDQGPPGLDDSVHGEQIHATCSMQTSTKDPPRTKACIASTPHRPASCCL